MRAQRIAENETIFRAANERVAGWEESQLQARRGEPLTLFCECANLGCREKIELTGHEYEAVRADSVRFAVVPGHVYPEAESVVEDHDRYVVVAEHAAVREIVEQTDPRKRTRPRKIETTHGRWEHRD